MNGVSVQAKSSLFVLAWRKARRRARIRQRRPGGTVPPVIASAATQSTFPRALAPLVAESAASATRGIGERGSVKSWEGLGRFGRIWIFRGWAGPGEVAAGSHTNSTVDVYAMNGVSVQALKFTFCSSVGQGAAASENTARKPGETVPPSMRAQR